jgi:phage terminase large subunit-like protein
LKIDCPEITTYLDMIEHDDEYPVCKEQKMLGNFVKNVFETENLSINHEQLSKYLGYQKYFPYKLFEWEIFMFTLHNCVYREDGLLRFPEAFLYMGRGGGKNGYLSFEDFCLLTPVNGVKDYHIDIFANSEDQAKTSFTDVYNVMERNERKLQKFFKWNLEVITSKQTGSQLRFRTSNAKTKDGGRPGKVDFDEFHAYENYDVVRVAKTGLGKKEFPRSTIITTDGDVRDGPLDHMLARSKQILQGAIPDNGLLPFICKLDKKEEVGEERNWYKANPSLRYFPNLMDELRREYADYKMDNIGNAAFMTKRMNIPQGSMETEVTAWENIVACSRPAKREPDVWVAGMDFARTTDFVAVVLFGLAGDEWVWQQHTWVCSQCKDLSRIKFPIQDAVERGLITWVEDVEIPPELPAKWLSEQMAGKRVIGVAIDDYRFGIMKKALEGVGFVAGKDGNILQVKGRNIMQIAPRLIAKLNRQQVAFGDDALMRWYINNTKQLLDTRGNITFGKIEPKTRKTDGFMAAVAAVTMVDRLELEQANNAMGFGVFTF